MISLLLAGEACIAQQRTSIHPTKRYAVFYEVQGKGFPMIPKGAAFDSTEIRRYADSTAAWLKQNPNSLRSAREQQRDSVMLNYTQIRQLSAREKSGERTLFHGAEQGLKVQREFRSPRTNAGKGKEVQTEQAADVYLLNPIDFQRLKAEFK